MEEKQKLTGTQLRTILGTYLGWSLDTFDFFILVFVMLAISSTFGVPLLVVSSSIIITLAMRFLGALFFGPIGDRYGRRITMMTSILFLAVFDFLVAFSPTITVFLVLRALYGFGMGGEWGSGMALAMESIPTRSRGWVAGLIQAGYPTGYLFAAIDFFVIFPLYGWRPMFFMAIIPAFFVLYIRYGMVESPIFTKYKERAEFRKTFSLIRKNYKLFIYLSLLLIGMNFVSHSTQDLYPTFLESSFNFSVHTVALIVITYNIFAIIGGIISGIISQSTKLGRKWTAITFLIIGIMIAPFWAYPQIFGGSLVLVLAFVAPVIMQFVVQAAWAMPGIYMNERSPAEARATLPGVAYMLGVMVASTAATIEILITTYFNKNYSLALLIMSVTVFSVTALIWLVGKDSKNLSLDPLSS